MVTAETLTDEQIRDARDQWPDLIGSECSADALALPRGPYEEALRPVDVERARASIAFVNRIHHQRTPRSREMTLLPPRLRAALLALRHAPDFVPMLESPAPTHAPRTVLSHGVLLLDAPPLALCGPRKGELP